MVASKPRFSIVLLTTLVIQPITHDELAATVGTAREVVSRTLKKFAADGWITTGRRRLVVVDRDALEDAAE